MLRAGDADELAERMRRSTFNGRPLGSDRFLAKLEAGSVSKAGRKG